MPWTIKTEEITLRTQDRDQIINLTDSLEALAETSGVREGLLTAFVCGATASITTLEFEPGLVQDMKTVLEEWAPFGRNWSHHQTWGDDNGGSHLRAALLGPSLSVPVRDGKLLLGTWQQVVLIDHDTRPRSRQVVLQIMGEAGRSGSSEK